MKHRIFLVDDDPFLSGSLQRVMERQGFEVHSVVTIESARAAFGRVQPHLVVLDLELPDGDGNDLCVWIRRQSDVPILILSSRSTSMDKVFGLNSGADDYLAKPFDGHEFLARVRALLRRSDSGASGVVTHGPLRIDHRTRQIFYSDTELPLTATEARIIECLIERPGETWERERLFKTVWGQNLEFSSNTMDVLISRIRRKFVAAGGADPIQTVRGIGYRLRL